MRKILLITSAFLSFTATALAAPKGAVELPSSEMFEMVLDGKSSTCGLVNGSWRVGRLLPTGLFLSHIQQSKNFKVSARKASGTKRTKLLSKSKKMRAAAKSGDPQCLSQGTGSPTPTSTPSSGGGNFNQNGDVTSAGKVLFGIPSHLEGNVSTGRTIFESMCSGCHGEYRGRTFSTYRSDTMRPEMDFTSTTLPDSSLAHLTAFLNRFRL